MIISPILPRIGTALDVSEALLGTLVTAYSVMLGLFAFIIGPISDKFGRRRVILAGTASMTVALALHMFAVNFPLLLGMRAFAGASGGMLSGAAVAYVGDYFPYERRGWANGWIMSGIAFGQIIGIPLGTILADAFGFRIPFLLFGGMMGAAFFLVWFFVPQPDVQRDTERLSIGRSLRTYQDMLRQPVIVAATMTYVLMFAGIGFYIVYMPTWIETHLGVSGTEIAMMFLIGGLANVVVGPMAGRLSDQFGRKPLIITSCLGLSLLMAATTFAVQNIFIAYVLFFLAMVLMAMRISPFQALLSELVPAERRGMLMGLAVGIGQFGIGVSGALAGPAYLYLGYLSNTLMGAVSMVLMAWVVWALLPEPELKTVEPAEV